MYHVYEAHLDWLKTKGRYRRLGSVAPLPPEHVNFSTNDYLYLSRHSKLGELDDIITQYGVGSTGSRLLSGNDALCEAFEAEIARDKEAEAALLFHSGFQANISTLSALLDQDILNEKPLVFFDKFNHASLYQAVFLSQAELHRYHHCDMTHLAYLLEKYQDDTRKKFIVTETVFGMDGDIVPIEQIVALAKKFDAFLYLDEAHATGLFGVNGYGLSTTVDLDPIPHVIMGTLSKAVGVSGGYIACHQSIRDFIINKAAGFIYSTAPSPIVVGAAFKVWKLIRFLDKERQILQDLGHALRTLLHEHGFDTGVSQTHIVPIIVKKEETCLTIRQALLEQGIVVSAVRPPTVPPGTARLRIALTTRHTHQDLTRLLKALQVAVST